MEGTRGWGCCCGGLRRRCLRIGELRFLAHVSASARPPPAGSRRCGRGLSREDKEESSGFAKVNGEARVPETMPSKRLRRATSSAAESHERSQGGGRRDSECKESKALSRFTPVFEKHAVRSLCSLNAGDPRLYVGGAGINLAFKRAIDGAAASGKAPEASRFDKCWGELMTRVHSKAMEAATKSATRVSLLTLRGGEDSTAGSGESEAASVKDLQVPFAEVHCMLPENEASVPLPEGAVFLDVFASDCHPEGNAMNAAMLYAVGPRGWLYTADRFYATVKLVAGNALRLVLRFNAKAGARRPLRVLRVPLISGGAFLGPHEARSVASAVVKGLIEAALQHSQLSDSASAAVAASPPQRNEAAAEERASADSSRRKRPSSERSRDAHSPQREGKEGAVRCSCCLGWGCCCCDGEEGAQTEAAAEPFPVIEFALVEGDLFWDALLEEHEKRKDAEAKREARSDSATAKGVVASSHPQ